MLPCAMSDSSSSDDEASKFKEVCDPTLWRTGTQAVSKGETCRVEVSDNQCYHHSQSDQRQSFILLEKIRSSLSHYKDKAACVRMRYEDDTTTHYKQAGRAETSTIKEHVSAPSTLSSFLAKQLTSRLDGNVEYQYSEEHKVTMGGSVDSQHLQPLQQTLHLLNNLPLTTKASIAPVHTSAAKRKMTKAPKRLTYFDGSDGEKLKSQCRSVAVSSEWILSGEAAYPRPEPKNMRYLQKYKLKERRADGSIVAIPCSLPDDAVTTTTTRTGEEKEKKGEGVACLSQTGKGRSAVLLNQGETLTGLRNGVSENLNTKKKKGVACVSQSGEEDSAMLIQEKTHSGLQNGCLNFNSNLGKMRKQTRKRGKKKKNIKGSDGMIIP